MWQQSSSTVGQCHSQPSPATACQPSLMQPPATMQQMTPISSMRLGSSGDDCSPKTWSLCCSQPPAKAKAVCPLPTCLLPLLLPAMLEGTCLLPTCPSSGLLPVSPSHQGPPRIMLGLPAVAVVTWASSTAFLPMAAQLLLPGRRAAGTPLLPGVHQWEAAPCTSPHLCKLTAVMTLLLAKSTPLILRSPITAAETSNPSARSNRPAECL